LLSEFLRDHKVIGNNLTDWFHHIHKHPTWNAEEIRIAVTVITWPTRYEHW
jgi:hypothetical protein